AAFVASAASADSLEFNLNNPPAPFSVQNASIIQAGPMKLWSPAAGQVGEVTYKVELPGGFQSGEIFTNFFVNLDDTSFFTLDVSLNNANWQTVWDVSPGHSESSDIFRSLTGSNITLSKDVYLRARFFHAAGYLSTLATSDQPQFIFNYSYVPEPSTF